VGGGWPPPLFLVAFQAEGSLRLPLLVKRKIVIQTQREGEV
jgi:hypothetical protein